MSDGNHIDLDDVIEICLRNTRYDTLEELCKGMRSDILAWVQNLYPNDGIVNFSRLRGHISEYSLAMRQEETCERCKARGGYKHCSTCGHYYEVYPVPNTIPRQFYVGYRECGYRRTAMDDEERKREDEPKAAPKGFSKTKESKQEKWRWQD
jgi:hypothetical protein